MSILWCGGEDIDFPNGSPPTVASPYRTAYARCALYGTGGAVSPCRSVTFSAVTSFWVSAQIQFTSIQNPLPAFGMMKSGTFGGLFVGSSTAAAGKLALLTRLSNSSNWVGLTAYTLGQTVLDSTYHIQLVTTAGTSGASAPNWNQSGGTTTDGSAIWQDTGYFIRELAIEAGNSIAYPTDFLYKFDMQVAAYGATAIVNVWLDGIPVIAFSGDATVPGLTSLDQVAFCGAGGFVATISEVIVADADTRTFSLVTLAPAGAGTTHAWTGAYTDVNEVTINDATAVYTNTAAQTEEFTLTQLPAGTFTVEGVKLIARAAETAGATADKVAVGVLSESTVEAGTPQALTTAWVALESLLPTNPVTSAAWTQTDVNALQISLSSST